MKTITITSCPAELEAYCKKQAKIEGKTLNRYVKSILDQSIENPEKFDGRIATTFPDGEDVEISVPISQENKAVLKKAAKSKDRTLSAHCVIILIKHKELTGAD